MKKILIIIGGVVITTIVFVSGANTFEKLVCKSPEGNIAIMYDDKVKYHISNNIAYDLDNQNALIEKIGIDAYLEYFSIWFSTNTSGTCTK